MLKVIVTASSQLGDWHMMGLTEKPDRSGRPVIIRLQNFLDLFMGHS